MKKHTDPTRLRDQKLAVMVDGKLMDSLRARVTDIERITGLHVSLSQVAEAVLRRGLETDSVIA